MPTAPLRKRKAAEARTNVVIGTIATAVASAALLAAALVQLGDLRPANPATHAAPHGADERSTGIADARPGARVAAVASSPHGQHQPLGQRGVIIAVSPDSVTVRSADGFTRTYRITPQTTTLTKAGSNGTASDPAVNFTIGDEVEIAGLAVDGAAVATVVADRSMTGPDGPPMHFIDAGTIESHGDGPVTLP
ncbi:hypothetical protein [Mycolicibacterium thermoresistibile]|uniref:DUF5666 domain-containing protein n=2 Tax=Mycolicibacterium thermoresistibile TaxID=1797 RepID=G7CM48_MYCT3|nr:hypothetical protein [Mycolicibacterium thermoresistibile]EHI11001.1 hypothetical protein KEK_20463 [Mycolicibacterium thermoresistibile ATCC 19527]MCV7188241.1 hypothetical protein [Mycolicibacterium thermoresistibile]GAT13317.1 putative uncharacterized protein [Mycolicibacterium thermoresistibile]SNW18508.1 Uncharacterised protein [Mycolicibacterium thermoresistibile]